MDNYRKYRIKKFTENNHSSFSICFGFSIPEEIKSRKVHWTHEFSLVLISVFHCLSEYRCKHFNGIHQSCMTCDACIAEDYCLVTKFVRFCLYLITFCILMGDFFILCYLNLTTFWPIFSANYLHNIIT